MRRIPARLLALCLSLSLLTACGGKGSEERKEGLFYDATGISPDTVLFTVGDRPVPAERYFYWLAYTCDYISSTYQQSGTEADWTQALSGETLGEYAQQQALDNTVLYVTVEAWAEQYGCQLTDDDLGAMGTEWDTRVQEYGSEEAYLEALKGMGIDKAGAQLMAADQYLYMHLYELYNTAGSALAPKAGELDAFAAQQGYMALDHLFVSTADVAPDAAADLAARRTQAEEALAKAKAGGDFSALAEQYGDAAARVEYPDGYTFQPGTGVLPDVVETAAKALKENELSPVVEADDGYYVLLRQPLNREALSPRHFDWLLQSAADNAEITYSDAWTDLSAQEFYEGLTAARAALTSPKK